MIIINREELKNDEVYNRLLQSLLKAHKVADHTMKSLIKNRHIKDSCDESRHFTIMDDGAFHLHYDTFSWLNEGEYSMRIDSVGIYDDFNEFEAARVGQLYSAKNADIPDRDGS